MKNKYKANKPFVKIAVVVTCVLIAVFLFVACQAEATNTADSTDENFVVFTVDGEPVTLLEFSHSVGHVRSHVISSYIVAGLDFGAPDFWHTPIDGITAFETLIQEATSRAARIKVIQMQALEHELIDAISYDSFMAAFIEENERREDTLAAGGVIFGPQQYNADLFFDIRAADLEAALRTFLTPLMGGTEEELQAFFDEEWQETPSEAGWVLIDKLYVPYMPSGYLFREEAYDLMQAVLLQAQAGEDFRDIAEAHRSVNFREQMLALRRGEGNIGQRASIQASQGMDTGFLSEIYEDQQSLAILLITDRNDQEYLTFDDLWVIMQRHMTVRNFAIFIDDILDNAEINMNDNVKEALAEILL